MAFILFEPLELPPAPEDVTPTVAVSYATLPFMPGHSFVDGYGYPVTVRTFEDGSEFRELPGRLASRELVYDYGHVDSAIAFGVQSFYALMGGPATPFYAKDYANDFTYLVRFDGPIEIQRTGNQFVVSPLYLTVVRDDIDQPDRSGGTDEGAGQGGAGT